MIKLLLSFALLSVMAWGQAFPPPGGVACGPGVTANCTPKTDATGNLAIGTTLLPGWQNIAAWGDSLTQGTGATATTTYPYVVGTSTGKTVYNGGNPGDTSTQIATRFLADTMHRNWFAVFWAGRNNYAVAPATVQADIAAMVAALPLPKRYLVLSVINADFAPCEILGGTCYATLIALNNALAATYPNNYVDVRAALVAAYSAGSPIDVIDHANDEPPASLRAVISVGTMTAGINSSTCTFTLTPSSGTVANNSMVAVDSEKIYITGLTGNNVTACGRGASGTTAASHLISAAYSNYDVTHLNPAGYAIVAATVNGYLLTHPDTTVINSGDIANLLAAPVSKVTTNLLAGTNGTSSCSFDASGYFNCGVRIFSQASICVGTTGATCWYRAGDSSMQTFQNVIVNGFVNGTSGFSINGGASWTSGTGAPSGNCNTGSLYSNVSGGASTTLYACTATNTWTAK